MTFQTDDVRAVITRDGSYCLEAPLVYQGRDETFIVPAGFVTDLASVPQFLTWLVPIAGIADRAAIVHDWLCVLLEHAHAQGWKSGPPHGSPANARDTDGIFRRILRELGVPTVRRRLFWVGVRWGALINPARRSGWLRDAPAVLGISVLALPIVLPASVVVGLGLLLYGIAETVAARVGGFSNG